MSKQLSLTRAQRRQVEAIVAELKPWGLRHEILKMGPHLKVRVWGPKGGQHALTVSGTPRDEDVAADLARQNARRLIRDINRGLGL